MKNKSSKLFVALISLLVAVTAMLGTGASAFAQSSAVEDQTITELSVTGMPELVVGMTVPLDVSILSVPENANYRVESIGWFDNKNEEWVSRGDVFALDKSYLFSVTLVPNDGYAFGESNALSGTINGQPAQIYKNGFRVTLSLLVGEPIAYSITFEANGGSGEMQTLQTGGNYTLPECEFTAPDGKEFSHWSVTDYGTKNVGDVIAIIKNTTVTAEWKDKPVFRTVSFNAGGGNGEMQSVTLESMEIYTLPECEFTPADQYSVFSRWLINGEFTKQPGEQLTLISDYTVTAVWSHACIATPVDAIDANCASEQLGKQAHFICNGCQTRYEDEAMQVKIENLENWGVIDYEHDFSGDMIFNNATNHGFKCVNPGCEHIGDVVAHEYTKKNSDETAHWDECECGARNNLVEHDLGELIEKTDATCQSPGMCAYYECECGALFDEQGALTEQSALVIDIDANAHSFGETWHSNAQSHWHECVCGATDGVLSHGDADGNNRCDACDYELERKNQGEENSSLSDKENSSLSGGAIAGIVIGATVILALGGFAIVWFVIRKKSFSDLVAVFKKK